MGYLFNNNAGSQGNSNNADQLKTPSSNVNIQEGMESRMTQSVLVQPAAKLVND